MYLTATYQIHNQYEPPKLRLPSICMARPHEALKEDPDGALVMMIRIVQMLRHVDSVASRFSVLATSDSPSRQ